jgi:GNAT superfamily N-acetyltransferase
MNIRNATAGDAAGIADLLHTMAELRSVFSETTAATARTVEQNLQLAVGTDRSMILVAEKPDGQIAGYCAVHWVPFLFQPGGEAYLTELFVRPPDTGKRVGTTLLDYVIAEARRRGCARISLLNGRDSEAYRRNFYAQRGWIERDRMSNFVFPLSNSQKRVSMLTSSRTDSSPTPASPRSSR